MSKTLKRWNSSLLLGAVLVLVLALFSACSAGSSGNDGSMDEGGEMEEMEHEEDGEHMEEGEHEEDEHEHTEDERIHNEGATIHIVSPGDGATFAEGEEVIVEVEVENFALGEDGSHWHIYIDGTSWGMVTGGDTDQALRGLEPGELLIETYLAGGDHIELKDGDAITVVVE
jgi:hypothetical protein